jgi:hypothetical protein
MSNWKKWASAGDIHGDQQDRKANKAFFKFQDLWKPDIRILNGDLWDFRPLRNGAGPDERRESMQADFLAGMDWIERFKPTHFNLGNHDDRLWELAYRKQEGPLTDLALRGVNDISEKLRHLRCKLLPYDKRAGLLRIGHAKWIHGFGMAAMTGARRHAMIYGSIHVNHFHSIQSVSIEGIDNRIGCICGCLCKLDMDYNARHLGALMHRHGWRYGVVNLRTGDFHSWQASEANGKWMLPTGIEEF